MKVTIAIDSLKGSLSSMEAGFAIEKGIRKVYPDASVQVRPLADGGEGTVVALADGLGGHFETVKVSDPLGRIINATYAVVDNSHTAIMEIASAAGLTLLSEKERNPYKTTARKLSSEP